MIILSRSEFAIGAGVHTAPIIIPGKLIRAAVRYPLSMYRLFRCGPTGKAESIPFQIDELNEFGDFILDKGSEPNAKESNGIFDEVDELSFMGDDVGPAQKPTSWPEGQPSSVYEIKLNPPRTPSVNNANNTSNAAPGQKDGAVYLAVFLRNAPPYSPKKYVVFDAQQSEVTTSRYRYGFDQKNWLVSRRVEVTNPNNPRSFDPILSTTTFYLRADFKYFLTFELNHNSIESKLEAFKAGAIRTIVRISFHYNILRMKLDLGMFTEVSFFSNAVYLPAVLFNPVDSPKSLNNGSGLYYGMSFVENPEKYDIQTNMPEYDIGSAGKILDFFKSKKPTAISNDYWISARGKDRMMYLEFTPSKSLQESGVMPMLYKENAAAKDILSRDNKIPNPLGKSPVNLGVYFDVTKFKEGNHVMGFRLFFENVNDQNRLDVFKSLNAWNFGTTRFVPEKSK